MSDKKEAEKAQIPTPRDIFEGIKGRPPETDRELEEWLASAEGKVATMFTPRLLLAGARGTHNGGNSALRDVEPLQQRSGVRSRSGAEAHKSCTIKQDHTARIRDRDYSVGFKLRKNS